MSDEISSLLSMIGQLTDRIAALENSSEESGGDSGNGTDPVTGLPSVLEADGDGTVRGYVFPDTTATVAVNPTTWWHPDGKVTSTLTTGLGTPTKVYIIATRTTTTLTISDTATLPTVEQSDTVRLLVTLTYDVDNNISDVKRHQVGDIFPSGAGSNPYSFKFTKTSSTGGDITPGYCFVGGILTTITDLPSSLSSITTSTKYWVAVTYATGAAVWTSGANWPTSTAAVECFRILEITCAGSVITNVIQRRCSDIHAVGGVTVDVYTSLSYSTSTHKLTYGKKTLTVLGAGSETTGQDFTNNDFVAET